MTLEPIKGTPRGGQVVTITGTDFGATQGTVTVGGASAVVSSWSDASVTFSTPSHRNAAGRMLANGSTVVSVVVTPTSGPAQTADYTYKGTLLDRALYHVRARLGAVRIAEGAFFDIHPAQVETVKKDGSIDTGAAYPQVLLFQESGSYPEQEAPAETTYGHYRGPVRCRCDAEFPIKDYGTWQQEATWLVADLFRAIQRANNDIGDGSAEAIVCGEWEIGQIAYEGQAGPHAGVRLQFTIHVNHIWNDMTTSTEMAP